ncbi:MAG: TIGR02449 family protein [Metallibacterium sp.]|uniref:TIGR02449 family protein n=1 Tax=mine drainage metagenome TaxID=410659 RepID=T1AQY7_9ZZZZ
MPPADPIRAELETLHALVERALQQQRRLADENRSLRHSQEQLATDRASLVARNDTARTRIEAMIQRLRALEQPPQA